jgi:ribosomal protein S18 acetylase RimI-like enzyme
VRLPAPGGAVSVGYGRRVRLVELRDRGRIAGLCGRRPGVHAYALGDLDDFFWPHTRWFGLEGGDGLAQVAFLYEEHDPPTLQAIPEEPVGSMAVLLEGLRGRLPERFECHVDEQSLATLLLDHAAVRGPFAHVKMQLATRGSLDGLARDDVTVLTRDDLEDVEALYATAYPGSWFHERRLETGRYVGVREVGSLVCAAGVHVHAPGHGVAALGDVATLPSARGRGLATATCASLCRLLHADGCTTIALNVREDNLPAIRAYERIGFTVATRYLEVTLQRRAS